MIASNERAPVIVAGVGHMVFPDLPLTYEGMQLLVPVEIRNKEHAKHKAVYGLIQAMARQLDDARMVSTIPPGQYLTGYKEEQDQVQTLFRIKVFSRKCQRSGSAWRSTITGELWKR